MISCRLQILGFIYKLEVLVIFGDKLIVERTEVTVLYLKTKGGHIAWIMTAVVILLDYWNHNLFAYPESCPHIAAGIAFAL